MYYNYIRNCRQPSSAIPQIAIIRASPGERYATCANQIGMKFCRNVLEVKLFHAEECCHLMSTDAASARRICTSVRASS